MDKCGLRVIDIRSTSIESRSGFKKAVEEEKATNRLTTKFYIATLATKLQINKIKIHPCKCRGEPGLSLSYLVRIFRYSISLICEADRARCRLRAVGRLVHLRLYKL